jgi:hypothetical protein
MEPEMPTIYWDRHEIQNFRLTRLLGHEGRCGDRAQLRQGCALQFLPIEIEGLDGPMTLAELDAQAETKPRQYPIGARPGGAARSPMVMVREVLVDAGLSQRRGFFGNPRCRL